MPPTTLTKKDDDVLDVTFCDQRLAELVEELRLTTNRKRRDTIISEIDSWLDQRNSVSPPT